jgi:hypothetical protein
MSDLCERFCPAYETCIQVFDTGIEHRASLLDQRKSVINSPELAEAADFAASVDLSDKEVDRLRADRRAKIAAAEDQLDYQIGLTEADLGMTASALLECAAAQTDCPGPDISRLGRLAMNLAALWHRQRPTWPERERYLGHFAQCASDPAKAASNDLIEALR